MLLRRSSLVLLTSVLIAGCGGTAQDPGVTQGDAIPGGRSPAQAAAIPACDADNGGLTLPEGFCALVVHEGVGPARHMAVAPNGDIYVAIQPRRGAESTADMGGIAALRDTTGDGRADELVRFGPTGGTGIAVHNGYLYFAPNTHVLRWRLSDAAELEPESPADTIVHGFPDQRSHAAKTLAFDGQGSMWVNVGGPSNACQQEDRQAGSPGQDPCPELERGGGVWRFDANRTGQHQRDGEHWATGVRNAVALAYHPAANALYAVQHGRDMLNVAAPDEFTPQENAELPSEEFLRLDRGVDYGWPYCYHDPRQGRRVLAPEYGGDGQQVGRCAQYPAPLTAYPAHWAPQELLFYTGEQYPARYREGAFIAWHGSWNRAPMPQRGYKVSFQPMSGGSPAGDWEVFADGFAGRETIPSPGEAQYRPMGLAQAPDGTLYVVDSKEGRIWRVVYRGAR
ncbi:MAG: PQQ-dependent sugar dehydrogenase [Gemmatimonadetes bacterium]|nr:PQQ-dependent sugar dehydrogenase [Gemmatimonadota bacterium]